MSKAFKPDFGSDGMVNFGRYEGAYIWEVPEKVWCSWVASCEEKLNKLMKFKTAPKGADAARTKLQG
jgi:hypothetical protein